jgi:long-chain acyl-CoA synthetase
MSSFAYGACQSLPAMFFEETARHTDKPFLWCKRDGAWHSLSWKETKHRIEVLARGLLEIGLKPGDRVLLVSENRPEWLIADIAVMAAGGITVPAYVTNTLADHRHLLNNSGARYAIVSTRALAERVIGAVLTADHDCSVISIEHLKLKQDPGTEVTSWDAVMALGRKSKIDIAAKVAGLKRLDLACIIYTSGTGGAPRGVMLSHGAIMTNCRGAYDVLAEIGLGDDVFLSFLPLSHAYEHLAGQFFPIAVGAQIYYAESVDQLAANMAEVHPTIMTAVPRLYETMRSRILSALQHQSGLKRRLFEDAVRLGAKRYNDPASLAWWEEIYDRLLDALVRRKVAERFGGRLKALVSGGAPLNFEVGLFFTALGVRLLQGYGQTEAAPLISVNPVFTGRLDSVGKAVNGVTVEVAKDGEILVQGENVMLGYWNDPIGTARAIIDGWLHTGDIGHIDSDGYIYITDRKKDLIVNSGGDNISPQRIEGFLALQPEIAQGMVYGDRRPHLVALLVPDAEFARAWALERSKRSDLEFLVNDGEFRRLMADAVERVNQHLSPMEKIRRFALLSDSFTVDNEMATPTLKIRRHVITARYKELITSLYEQRGTSPR